MTVLNERMWIAHQNWEHVLFLHWPISEKILRPYIKEPFELQTFNNQAWLTIVLFQATGSRFRSTPTWTTYPDLTQVNVRTYVKLSQINATGVYFLSLSVNSLLATLGANMLFGLPFNSLQTAFKYEPNPYSIQYQMHDHDELLFHIDYKQQSQDSAAEKSELTKFLTERFRILTIKGEKIIKIPVTHTPWELKNAEVQLQMSHLATDNFDMIIPSPIRLQCIEEPFVAHYSRFKRTKLHMYETLGLLK